MANHQTAEWCLPVGFLMKLIREIPMAYVVHKEINDIQLEQFGFTLVWTEESVRIYTEAK